ncbi:MAG: aminotransferase class V-fold PLP-dependent enzyme [Candidatus Aenigmarchaeota archaeon]|nr:aminotransferase class V-fold PLP-dependent enzyme [Candidatus Aenigmarchaeota archaeon]
MNIEKIREDFPVLSQKLKAKPIIYMDSACMSLKPRQVIETMNAYYYEYSGCAGRSSHKLGKKTDEEYHKAREMIAKFIGAKPNETVFTRNTTEGINLVANSIGLKPGNVVLTTDKEHNSNLLPWQILANKGIKHFVLESNNDNTFNIDAFQQILEKHRPKLVSVVHTSNLDGVTNPVKDIAKISHEYDAVMIVDAAQSVPHKKIDVKHIGCDFLAFSGHKMLGPTGTGALYGRYELLEKMHPFLVGGDTVVKTTYINADFEKPPEKFEAGLQNYAGMIGMAAACKYLDKLGLDDIEKHEAELNRIITDEIKDIPGLRIIGPADARLRAGIISFTIDKIPSHDIALMLDEMQNIMIRSGQHCVHSWFNANNIEGSARASLYLYNTKEEAQTFIEILKKIAKLR